MSDLLTTRAFTPDAAAAWATRHVDVGGRTLACFDVGTGPAVVIVHGVGGHKEDWRAAATALAAQGRRVVAVDMLGFGESEKSGDLAIPAQADAVRALLDALGLARVSLVGNSVGGWVAATFAATYPTRIDRLVLVDSAGFRAMFEGPPPVNFDPDSVEEMDRLVHVCINSDVADAPGFAAHAFERYVASGEKAVSATWGAAIFGSPRLEELLPRITAPTVVLWGADDRLFPSVLGEVFAAQVPGARAQLIPGAGHFPHLDAPAATLGALEAALA